MPWLTHGAVSLAALLVGVGIGTITTRDDDRADVTAAPATMVTVTATTRVTVPGPTVTVATTLTAKPELVTVPPPTEVATGPATEVAGNGEYLVGEDIKPGTYKTAGATSYGCYWERAKNSSGEFDAIIANQNLTGTGRVTLRQGEVFKSSGCKSWTKVD